MQPVHVVPPFVSGRSFGFPFHSTCRPHPPGSYIIRVSEKRNMFHWRGGNFLGSVVIMSSWTHAPTFSATFFRLMPNTVWVIHSLYCKRVHGTTTNLFAFLPVGLIHHVPSSLSLSLSLVWCYAERIQRSFPVSRGWTTFPYIAAGSFSGNLDDLERSAPLAKFFKRLVFDVLSGTSFIRRNFFRPDQFKFSF